VLNARASEGAIQQGINRWRQIMAHITRQLEDPSSVLVRVVYRPSTHHGASRRRIKKAMASGWAQWGVKAQTVDEPCRLYEGTTDHAQQPRNSLVRRSIGDHLQDAARAEHQAAPGQGFGHAGQECRRAFDAAFWDIQVPKVIALGRRVDQLNNTPVALIGITAPAT
jgi:hypothetical protein